MLILFAGVLYFFKKVTVAFSFGDKSEGFVIKGKHTGVKGKITEIIEQGGKKIAVISDDKEKINVWIKNVIAM